MGDSDDANMVSAATLAVAMMPEFIHIGQ